LTIEDGVDEVVDDRDAVVVLVLLRLRQAVEQDRTGSPRGIRQLLGHERHLIVRAGDARFVVREPSDGPDVRSGATIHLSVEADEVHLFDETTTWRVN
jgi:hypothetical protein